MVYNFPQRLGRGALLAARLIQANTRELVRNYEIIECSRSKLISLVSVNTMIYNSGHLSDHDPDCFDQRCIFKIVGYALEWIINLLRILAISFQS